MTKKNPYKLQEGGDPIPKKVPITPRIQIYDNLRKAAPIQEETTGQKIMNGLQKVTAVTQFVPIPWISLPSMAINSALGAKEAYDYYQKGDMENAAISGFSALPFRLGAASQFAKVARSKKALNGALDIYGAAADVTDNFFNGKKKKGGAMNPYKLAQGGNASGVLDFIFEEDETPTTADIPTEEAPVEEPPRGRDRSAEDDAYTLQLATQDFSSVHKRRNPYYREIAEMDGEPDEEEGEFNFAPSSRSAASASYSSGSKKDVNENAKYAFQYLQKKGLAPHIAAGIVGNLMQESGLRTDVKGDQGQALGIAQWHKDRQKGLFKFAGERNPYSLDVQLDYVLHEAGQRGDLEKVGLAKNSEEAAYLFAKHFEKPKTIESIRGAYAKSLHP